MASLFSKITDRFDGRHPLEGSPVRAGTINTGALGNVVLSDALNPLTLTLREWAEEHTATVATLEMPPTPQPAAFTPAVEIPSEEYRQLAAAIGFSTPAMFQAELEAELAQNYHVYDYAKVEKYMDALVAKENAQRAGTPARAVKWYWRPLRAVDTLHNTFGMVRIEGVGRLFDSSDMAYDKAVPMPVLQTVHRLTQRFEDRVKFYVTDYSAVRPDPFLGVTAENLPKMYVIERWDEPSFRG